MRARSDETGPRWSALRVGPGGVPAEQVRPTGLPDRWPAGAGAASQAAPEPVPGVDTQPHAVLGSFDEGRPRRRSLLAVAALAVATVIVVAAALWSDGSVDPSASVDLREGDCLASSGGQTIIGLDCAAPAAEFVVAARFDDTTDDARCSAVTSDVVLVTRTNVLLCLNYVARVGDCLYASGAVDVGKAPCRTGSGAAPRGLFRVIAVLTDTVSARGCPPGTLDTLVHRDSREVVCLGLP